MSGPLWWDSSSWDLPIIYPFACLSSSYDPWLSRILFTTVILCIDRARCLPVNHLWSTHTSLQKESLDRAELGSGVSRLHIESLEFSGGTFTETVLFDINCWLVRLFFAGTMSWFCVGSTKWPVLDKKQTNIFKMKTWCGFADIFSVLSSFYQDFAILRM